MPPSSTAIRLAESPSAHSFFRSSTRSSVHIWPLHQQSTVEGRVRPAESPIVSSEGQSGRRTARSTRWNSGNGPPQNEMSYLRVSRVQYGGTPAQESGRRPGRFLPRSEEHTSELQSHVNLVCRLLLEKKKKKKQTENNKAQKEENHKE